LHSPRDRRAADPSDPLAVPRDPIDLGGPMCWMGPGGFGVATDYHGQLMTNPAASGWRQVGVSGRWAAMDRLSVQASNGLVGLQGAMGNLML
jgi:hypothetical protein